MATTALTRSFGTATSTQKFTISVWVKRSSLATSGYQNIWHTTDGSYDGYFRFRNSENQLQLNMGIASPNTPPNYRTNRIFTDVNAWYHIVAAVDTTLSTASDRVKFYVNGTRETSFQSSDAPTQNNSYSYLSSSGLGYIGRNATSASNYFDGSMSHFHFIDGTAYDASPFGSTDSTTGEWKINTSPSVTYGNNGYFILKDGNSVTDQSGEGNNFTVASGTLTKTEDNPSNVFATMNPLVPTSSLNFSNGNTTLTGTNATNYSSNNTSTLGASSGKYYFEIEYDTAGSNTSPSVGISLISIFPTTNPTGSVSDLVVITMENQIYVEGTNSASYLGSTPSTGDIIQIALDMDNGKVFFGLNGTFVGDPVAGSGSAFSGITSGETIALNIRPLNAVFKCNFGNGYFGTTAVSSAGTNASNNGIFEYDVPTGYTALSTKGLNL